MTNVTIEDLALAARKSAADVVIRHKKHASFRLYGVLAACMLICERALLDPKEESSLRTLINGRTPDGSRRYVETRSDIYQVVCRFVFSGTNLTNATRYAQALREASKLQIRSSELTEWMKTNGGVNALYFRRPIKHRNATLRTLRLSAPLTFPRDTEFTITLKWQPDNTFRVTRSHE